MSAEPDLSKLFNLCVALSLNLSDKMEHDHVFRGQFPALEEIQTANQLFGNWLGTMSVEAADAINEKCGLENVPTDLALSTIKLTEFCFRNAADQVGEDTLAAYAPAIAKTDAVSQAFRNYNAPTLAALFAPKIY